MRIYRDLDGAHRRLGELDGLGLDFGAVLDELEKEGVQKFADSWHQLLKAIEEKQSQVQPA